MISEAMRDRARQLRSDATQFEQTFWLAIRAGRFSGYKFRRQQVIGPYIVDFVCQQARLIIELDGSQHLDAHDYDRQRDAWLNTQGYRVLRVWNHEWSAYPQAVLEKLWIVLCPNQPSPQPLTPDGGGAFNASCAGSQCHIFPSPIWGEGLGERALAAITASRLASLQLSINYLANDYRTNKNRCRGSMTKTNLFRDGEDESFVFYFEKNTMRCGFAVSTVRGLLPLLAN